MRPVSYVSFDVSVTRVLTWWYALQGEYDAIIIPGGLKGAETISQSSVAQSLVKSFHETGKVVGMICAGE
jgi:putative intracellular protease/amidase